MVKIQGEAVQLVLNKLKTERHSEIFSVKNVNENKHTIISSNLGDFFVLFKRDFFLSFGKIFSNRSVGESINSEALMFADKNKSILLFVYPDGKVYSISSSLFKKLAEDNEWIRQTKADEKTYSIPLKYLTRW